jgi:hypothetical protein
MPAFFMSKVMGKILRTKIDGQNSVLVIWIQLHYIHPHPTGQSFPFIGIPEHAKLSVF